MRTLLLSFLSIPLATFFPQQAQSQPASAQQHPEIQITEWTVPWEKSRPRDPYIDPKGRAWFVGQTGNYIAYLDPASGKFERIEIEPGTNPHNLIVDRAGNVWYAGNRNGRIGRIDAATRKITTYMMPDSAVRDPHTLVFDQAGDIWFTAQRANYVGHLATKTGKIRVARVPTANSLPYGIIVDSRSTPWFVQFGSNKISSIDPVTLQVTEHSLPNAASRSRRLVETSDGAIWYADYTRGMVARFDPRTGAVREWPAPSGARSLPYAMAVDDRDRVWMVETGVQPNRLVGFDTKTQAWIASTPIAKSGGQSVRHMVFHQPTRTLWFGTDANTIARAKLP